jgi:hypothetical protein
LFDVVRRRWSTNVALVSAALVAVNPALLEYAAIPVSEMMFTSLTLWALWAADRVDTGSRQGTAEPRRRPGGGAAAIVLAVLAALTRSAGVTLPLALVAHWAWRRRWRAAAAMALAAAVFVGSWLAWTSLAPRREVRMSYIDDAVRPVGEAPSLMSVLAKRVAYNVPTYITQVSLTVVPVPVTRATILDNVGWVLLLGTCVLAGWFSAWTRWNGAAIYLVAYCGLLAVWPYLLDRFLVPALPLALTLAVVGIATIARRLGQWREVPVAALGALLAFFALRADAAMVDKALSCDRTRVDCASPTSLDYIDASRLAAKVSPPNARFIAPKGSTLYFHGGRQAVFWEEAVRQDSASFLPYLRRNGITHILSTPVYADYVTILSLVQSACMRFSLVHAFSPHTSILAFRDSAASAPDGERACAFVRRALATARVVAAASGPETGAGGLALGPTPSTRGGKILPPTITNVGARQVRDLHTSMAEGSTGRSWPGVDPHNVTSTSRSSVIRMGHATARTTRGVARTKHRYLLPPHHGRNQRDHAGRDRGAFCVAARSEPSSWAQL